MCAAATITSSRMPNPLANHQNEHKCPSRNKMHFKIHKQRPRIYYQLMCCHVRASSTAIC